MTALLLKLPRLPLSGWYFFGETKGWEWSEWQNLLDSLKEDLA
jgi:hypothetical protein